MQSFHIVQTCIFTGPCFISTQNVTLYVYACCKYRPVYLMNNISSVYLKVRLTVLFVYIFFIVIYSIQIKKIENLVNIIELRLCHQVESQKKNLKNDRSHICGPILRVDQSVYLKEISGLVGVCVHTRPPGQVV